MCRQLGRWTRHRTKEDAQKDKAKREESYTHNYTVPQKKLQKISLADSFLGEELATKTGRETGLAWHLR